MKVHLLKPMLHDHFGRLAKGSVVDLPDFQAKDFVQNGFAEYYQTKVINERPLTGAGADTPSFASLAAPASPKTISKPSKFGGRKKKTEPSLS